jgi:hypothetical protein
MTEITEKTSTEDILRSSVKRLRRAVDIKNNAISSIVLNDDVWNMIKEDYPDLKRKIDDAVRA